MAIWGFWGFSTWFWFAGRERWFCAPGRKAERIFIAADALLFEKLRHGLDSGDTYAFGISGFVEDYKGQILAILVDQLSSRDRTTRKYANEILKRLTGQDFGFEPDRFVGQQDEVIEQWRTYVDNYLNEQ